MWIEDTVLDRWSLQRQKIGQREDREVEDRRAEDGGRPLEGRVEGRGQKGQRGLRRGGAVHASHLSDHVLGKHVLREHVPPPGRTAPTQSPNLTSPQSDALALMQPVAAPRLSKGIPLSRSSPSLEFLRTLPENGFPASSGGAGKLRRKGCFPAPRKTIALSFSIGRCDCWLAKH